MPVVVLNSPHVSDMHIGGNNPSFGTALDIIGIIVWVIGWVIESTADVQKVSESRLISCCILLHILIQTVSLESIKAS